MADTGLRVQKRGMRLGREMGNGVGRMQGEARLRREVEATEKERKVREVYGRKAAGEEAEARRAEKLVKELERKEREWIAKLRNAQLVQEDAFEHLESALMKLPEFSPTKGAGAAAGGYDESGGPPTNSSAFGKKPASAGGGGGGGGSSNSRAARK